MQIEEEKDNCDITDNIKKSDNPESSKTSSEGEESDIENLESMESRKSLRIRRKPTHLDDYATYAEAFIIEDDPKTFSDAMSRDDKEEWRKAMDTEIDSMHSNHAWDLVPLPVGKFAINNKWVFRLKRNPDGTIDKYRARMVIQGCAQRPGIDYKDTFSPVTRLDTIRTLSAVAASEKMKMMQFDVSTAFLYGNVNEEIYMKQPIGYQDGTNRVCRLKRSLYGLKQASRCWNHKFDDFMVRLKFAQSREDPCVYIRGNESRKIIVALYVDDGLVVSKSDQEMKIFIEELKLKFKVIGKELTYFL